MNVRVSGDSIEAGMKDEKFLEEIKSRVDIVDFISGYVELKRAGQNFKGLCPFHSEKTPSFMVNPGRQIFHCFGCGAGGNVIHFAMKYENLSFQESLRLLAKKAGIEFKAYKSGGEGAGLREKLVGINKAASKIFAENLTGAEAALKYLKGRGLTDETVRLFSLGYALKEWRHLSNQLQSRKFSQSLMKESGLVSSGEKGIYDIFRGRIMFPICDIQGDIIAFGGRVLDDSQPKYLNSPDSPLFRKGETLYGLNLAKDGIRKKGYAIIAEGYFDVIVCRQFGFDNVVAPLGTALSAGHLRKLNRFTRKAVLVFDGDNAGEAAAKRSIPMLLEQGYAAGILLLPGGEDPDSFLRKKGQAAMASLIEKAKSPVDFLLEVSAKDKAGTVREALEIISPATDAIMKEELLRELSEKTGLRETVIREELKALGRKKVKGKEADKSPSSSVFCYDEEILLLSAVIAFPDRTGRVLQALSGVDFNNPVVASIFEKLSKAGDIEALSACLEEEERTLVTRLSFYPGFDHDSVDKNIEDCIRKIGGRKFLRRRELIHEKIKKAEVTGEQDLLNSLMEESQRLIRGVR